MKQRRQWREDAAIKAAYVVLFVMIIVIVLLIMFRMAQADEKHERLAVLATLAAIDYDQSAGWVTPGGRAIEINRLLGPQPTRKDMLMFGTASIAVAWALSEVFGEWVLDSAITSEAWNIEDNRLLQEGRRRRINAIPLIVTVRW